MIKFKGGQFMSVKILIFYDSLLYMSINHINYNYNNNIFEIKNLGAILPRLVR